MKVHPLEQFYKENVNRLKEQMKILFHLNLKNFFWKS